MKLETWLVVILLACLPSCTKTKDLIGIYTIDNLEYSLDTLKLNANGIYERNLFGKKDRKVLFRHNGKWSFNEGRIKLFNFLQNSDSNYHKSIPNFDNVLRTSSFPVDQRDWTYVIYCRVGYKETYYKKL